MTDQEQIYQKISAVLVELFEIDPAAIHPQAHLYQDLDIDSIDAVDLMVELKKMTGKKIQPEGFRSARTVQDVVDQVYKLLNDG